MKKLTRYWALLSGEALVYGTLDYSWNRPDHTVIREQLRFFAKVFLTNANRYGRPLSPTAEYQVLLETARSDYQVVAPISHELQPSDSDRFNVRIGAQQSSRHRLNLRLVYNDGLTLPSIPVSLEMFVPRRGFKKKLQEAPS